MIGNQNGTYRGEAVKKNNYVFNKRNVTNNSSTTLNENNMITDEKLYTKG